MAKPTSPSWPHRSKQNPNLHVDIQQGRGKHSWVNVKDPKGAYAIGGAVRDQARKSKGRKAKA